MRVWATPRVGANWPTQLVLLVLLSELAPFSFGLVLPALPAIATHFETDRVVWVLTIVQLSGACAMPLLGRLADAHGKRRLLLVTAAIAGVGALLSFAATSYAVLLIGRFLEGVSLGIIPLTYSLIRDVFPVERVPFAVSVSAAGIGLSTIAAPLLSGWLVDSYGFRAVFGFLFLMPVILCPAVLAAVPESTTRSQGKMDWLGGIVLSGSFGLALLGISNGRDWGWTSPAVIGCLLGAAASFVVWLLLEQRSSSPLIQLELIRSRPIAAAVTVNVLAQAVISIVSVLLVLLVETSPAAGAGYGLGRTALGLAAFTVPGGLITIAIGFVAGPVLRSRTPSWLAAAGFGVAAVGVGILLANHASEVGIAAGFWVFAVGSATVLAAVPNLVISATPAADQAATASIVGVAGTLGAAVGLQGAYLVLDYHLHGEAGGTLIYADLGLSLVLAVVAVLAIGGVFAARAGSRQGSRRGATWQ